jgi:hypothetical protein
MGLHVILGFQTTRNHEEPGIVYAGRSGPAARAAMEASTYEWHLVFQNCQHEGFRKHNARAAANRAALDPAAQAVEAERQERERLEAEQAAGELRRKARAAAKARVAAEAVAEVAVGAVQDALATVVSEAAEEGEPARELELRDGPEPAEGDDHFGVRRRKRVP